MFGDYHKIYGIQSIIKSAFKKDDWRALKPVDILFAVHDGHRTYEYKDKAYSPLIDSLQEQYLKKGFSCLTIALPFSQLTKSKAFGNVMDFNGSFFRAALFRTLANIWSKNEFLGARYKKKVWKKILDATNPRHVIAIMPDAALCSECRAKNIKVTDLQHGVINDGHPWYGENYKGNVETENLPTSFMCWDNAAVETLEKWVQKKGIQIDLIKNPWSQRFIENNPEDELIAAARESSFWLLRLPKMKRILITLGWGWTEVTDESLSKQFDMQLSMPHFQTFPTPLLDIIRDTHKEIIWFVRLHPIQLQGVEGKPLEDFLSTNFGGMSNVYWREVSTTPLTILLESTDLHITIASSVTSEAAAFGIKTGLVAPIPRPPNYLSTYFEAERKNNMAEFVSNTGDKISQFIKTELNQTELEAKSRTIGGGIDLNTKNVQ